MKNANDVVTVLSELSARDRRWILEHLSAKSRNALLTESSGKTSAAPSAPARDARTTEPKRLPQSPVALASRLKSEPAWIIDAALQLCDAEQRAAVVHELPHAVRHEVERVASAKRQHTARVLEFLAKRLAVDDPTVAPPAESQSPFAKLVDRVSQRLATKRLRMRA